MFYGREERAADVTAAKPPPPFPSFPFAPHDSEHSSCCHPRDQDQHLLLPPGPLMRPWRLPHSAAPGKLQRTAVQRKTKTKTGTAHTASRQVKVPIFPPPLTHPRPPLAMSISIPLHPTPAPYSHHTHHLHKPTTASLPHLSYPSQQTSCVSCQRSWFW